MNTAEFIIGMLSMIFFGFTGFWIIDNETSLGQSLRKRHRKYVARMHNKRIKKYIRCIMKEFKSKMDRY